MDETIEQPLTPKPHRPTVRLKTVLWALAACAGGILATVILVVQFQYAGRIKTSLDDVPARSVAIVLGASVKKDGTPSAALEDRILTAAELYKAGKVDSLLMTGDDGQFHIDEIKTMARVAREAGIPDKAIQTDGHGYRTYESCKRAHEVFGITEAIVVTQRFHLGRALYLCNRLGVDAVGLAADRSTYDLAVSFWLRDMAASFKAFLDVNLIAPKPPVK